MRQRLSLNLTKKMSLNQQLFPLNIVNNSTCQRQVVFIITYKRKMSYFNQNIDLGAVKKSISCPHFIPVIWLIHSVYIFFAKAALHEQLITSLSLLRPPSSPRSIFILFAALLPFTKTYKSRPVLQAFIFCKSSEAHNFLSSSFRHAHQFLVVC